MRFMEICITPRRSSLDAAVAVRQSRIRVRHIWPKSAPSCAWMALAQPSSPLYTSAAAASVGSRWISTTLFSWSIRARIRAGPQDQTHQQRLDVLLRDLQLAGDERDPNARVLPA